MSKHTAEQVESAAEILEQDQNAPSWKRLSEMLNDYAALLRERESAKAVVTDELAERVLNRYVNECISHLDEAPVHLRVTAMRTTLEAVAPMLSGAHETPCSLAEALNVMENWAIQGNALSGDDVERFRAIAERIEPMLASALIIEPVAWRYRLDGDMQWQHTSDKRICVGEIEPLYNAMSVASARVPDELSLGQRAVAAELLGCCESWEPGVRVMGNVKAGDAADLLRNVLAAAPKP